MAAPAILLDLDGTLWDSNPWYAQRLASPALPPDQALDRLVAGANVIHLAASCGSTRSGFLRACRTAADYPSFYPGVAKTLHMLRERGTLLAVVTNLPGTLAEPLLNRAGLGGYFGSVVCNARKPSGSGIVRALGALGMSDRAACVYVGDRLTDGQAAQAAGVSFAWAAYGYGAETPPTDSYRSLSEFADLLKI